jgi:prepilin-type N-terminal cleavage/methylation domain-containing protein
MPLRDCVSTGHLVSKFEGSAKGFTLVELLAVLAVIAVLALMLLPAIAGTKPNSQAFRCLSNQKQITLAWLMYAEDNRDILPPNDYPFTTEYFTQNAGTKARLKDWVVGTMAQPIDSAKSSEFTDPNSLLSGYVTNPVVYRCPADNYIDPYSHMLHARSYSMNSAVGSVWNTFYANGSPAIGSPVLGGWLPGTAYNGNQTTWLTYGKTSSFTRPGPASTFLLMDENPYFINDGSIAIPAAAAPGATYIIDFPAGNHDGGACISFADGHAIVHKWLDLRTVDPQSLVQSGQGGASSTLQTPDNPDCFYLAPITSALR